MTSIADLAPWPGRVDGLDPDAPVASLHVPDGCRCSWAWRNAAMKVKRFGTSCRLHFPGQEAKAVPSPAVTGEPQPRLCADCGADLSGRHYNTIRCDGCARQRLLDLQRLKRDADGCWRPSTPAAQLP